MVYWMVLEGVHAHWGMWYGLLDGAGGCAAHWGIWYGLLEGAGEESEKREASRRQLTSMLLMLECKKDVLEGLPLRLRPW